MGKKEFSLEEMFPQANYEHASQIIYLTNTLSGPVTHNFFSIVPPLASLFPQHPLPACLGLVELLN